MTTPPPTLGVIFPPDQPPERLFEVAAATEAAGVEQLWLWEDCFKESGVAPAVAVLARTERLRVGIGLLPVPLRNVALTAMELATVERLFPGRLVPGIGHGVLDWMAQVGARVESPMTLLREYAGALRALLHGERVTVDGRYVQLADVALDWPPDPPPPLLMGAVGAKTLRLAGELADGVVLTGENPPEKMPTARAHLEAGRAESGRSTPFAVVSFVPVGHEDSVDLVLERVRAHATAGATTTALLVVGDDGPPLGAGDPSLAGWVTEVGAEVARRLRSD